MCTMRHGGRDVNSIKNLLVVAVLLGVGYAVYTTINSNPGSTPPSGEADNWPSSVDVRPPATQDGKSAASKNPFAPGGSKKAERVAAQDTPAFGGSRAAPAGPAGTPGSPAAADRGPRASFPADGRSAAPAAPPARSPADSLRVANPRPGDPVPGIAVPGVAVPGVAVSTDIPGSGSSTLADELRGGPRAVPARTASSEVRKEFVDLMEDAHRRLGQGALAEVHLALSKLYGSPDLSSEESRQLTELLDQLTGTVIYSRQHLLEQPYVVKQGESLLQIAQRYNVPWQVLAKINGVRDPDRLEPGRRLKVFQGPFEAVVSLERYEMVLMLGERYAGRFPIGIGRDLPPREGSYTVKKKTAAPGGPAPDRGVAGSDPGNAWDKYWIELGDQIGIHGTGDTRNLRRSGNQGSICVGPRDIQDVYDILSADSSGSPGSKVTIRR
jgi:LysM repeat protein